MSRIKRFFSMPFGAGITGGLVVGLVGWLAIAAGWIESDPETVATTASATSIPASEPAAVGDALTAGEIYEKAGPAVAFVAAEQSGSTSGSPLGPVPGNGGTATGSGFLIDDAGTILTNAHVVDGSEAVTVKLGEDGETLDAEVVGADDSTDVAVLRVDPDKVQAAPLRIGDSDAATVGDAVVAIGNPFGLDRTVTTGIVSGLQREISAPDGFTISDVIQTDAAINPGNSGGPLISSVGEVLGINSQIATAGGGGSVGVGFAVPINTAQRVADQILDDGRADHAFIGISGADLTPQIADVLNLDLTEGALVQDVTPGSPADDAGLKVGDATMSVDGNEIRVGGDVITAVDGEPVTGMDDVVAAVNRKVPGDKLTLEISRGGEPKTVELTLADRPAKPGS
ncbi:MAG: trypsin-like peptidase domain-containing protein [Solirubrobacterales bacterium]